MVKALITTRMGQYSVVFGAMTSSMDQGKRPTQMARNTLAITRTANEQAKGNISGPMAANTMESGLKIRFTATASIDGAMAEST